MGILAKYTEERKISLAWWKKLNISKKKEAVSIWQEQLPETDTCKDWAYELIAYSSLKIELIYKFFHKIV